MSFKNLRKNSGSALANLQQKIHDQQSSGGGGSSDGRFWKMPYDKNTKKGTALIRFLPYGQTEGRLPWAEWFEFSFKNKGKNYWERSLRTIGEADPVAELNGQQWERNQGNDQDDVKKRGRRQRFVANIVVLEDKANPENQGKTFLFEYGPAIHKLVMAKMVPEHEDQTPCNVFDLWEGANFRIRTKDKSGYVNYDDSTFESPSALHSDDDVLEKIYNSMIALDEFEARDNYKTYAELEAKMLEVLGAHYVASIRGEPVQYETAGNTGTGAGNQANPFAGQSSNSNTENSDKADGGSDPFAGIGGAEGGETKADGGSDPFAGMGGGAAADDGDDPFANLKL